MNKIKVSLKESNYLIYIGEKTFTKIPDLINKLKLNKNIMVIVDKNVNSFHERKIHQDLKNLNAKKIFYHLNPGEKTKSYSELCGSHIYERNSDHTCAYDTIGSS